MNVDFNIFFPSSEVILYNLFPKKTDYADKQ